MATVRFSRASVGNNMLNSCALIVENTLALVIPDPEAPLQPTALSQIVALVQRSDSIAIKSEGTRVIVNAVKSLWSPDASSEANVGQRRKEAMQLLVTPAHAAALAQLIGRSRKYPILINEGSVALLLLSTHAHGGKLARYPLELSMRH